MPSDVRVSADDEFDAEEYERDLPGRCGNPKNADVSDAEMHRLLDNNVKREDLRTCKPQVFPDESCTHYTPTETNA